MQKAEHQELQEVLVVQELMVMMLAVAGIITIQHPVELAVDLELAVEQLII